MDELQPVSAPPRSQWASPGDWDKMKETITEIYWEQYRPLKDVIEIMEQQHGFYATPKMYKTRLKKWGVTKYHKDKGGQTSKADGKKAGADGNVAVRAHHGRRALVPKLPNTKTALVRAKWLSPSPSSTNIDAPPELMYVEGCFSALLDFSKSRMQNGTWDATSEYDDDEDDNSNIWSNKVLLCHNMMKSGKIKEGFKLLEGLYKLIWNSSQVCLKLYKTLIQKEHPLLILETFTTFLSLSTLRHDIAQSILNYIAKLCFICLGPTHPYTRLWSNLQALDISQIKQLSTALVKAQMSIFETYFAPDAEFLLCHKVIIAKQIHCYGNLPIQQSEADIAEAIRMRTLKGLPDTIDFVVWAKERLAYIYHVNAKYAEANAILDEVWLLIEKDTPGLTNFVINEYYSTRCTILKTTGPYEELIDLFLKKLEWNLKVVGPGHSWTTRTVAELDQQYELKNNVEASARLHEMIDLESTWDAVLGKEDNEGQKI